MYTLQEKEGQRPISELVHGGTAKVIQRLYSSLINMLQIIKHFIAIVPFQPLNAAHLMFKTIILQLFPTMELASNFPFNADTITDTLNLEQKPPARTKAHLNLLLIKVSLRCKVKHVTMSFQQRKGQNQGNSLLTTTERSGCKTPSLLRKQLYLQDSGDKTIQLGRNWYCLKPTRNQKPMHLVRSQNF